MDAATARELNKVTGEFYRRQAASFSETRQRAWDGWDRVCDAMGAVCVPGVRVLDAACGNLRFERYLAERLAAGGIAAEGFGGPLFEAYAVDNCVALAEDGVRHLAECVHFVEYDVMEALFSGDEESAGGRRASDPARSRGLTNLFADAVAFDAAVAFGFMHHVALPEHRARLLGELVRAVRPGGFVAVSFWQFMNDERIARKAVDATERGCAQLGLEDCLGENDYLLGWQQASDVFRFCHHFPEGEIDRLVEGLACVGDCEDRPVPLVREIARFSADGKSGSLNRYLVLQVLG